MLNPIQREILLRNLWRDAQEEARRAALLFPQPNPVALAFAEEAGELVKATMDIHHGKGGQDEVYKEMVQTLAMVIRLATEGDGTLDDVVPLEVYARD